MLLDGDDMYNDEMYDTSIVEKEENYFVFIYDEEGEFSPRWLEAWAGEALNRAVYIALRYMQAGFDTDILDENGEPVRF